MEFDLDMIGIMLAFTSPMIVMLLLKIMMLLEQIAKQNDGANGK